MSNFNKNKKYHFIYKTTNKLNGNYYIGMHSTNNLNDGYMGSGKRLKRSLNKYGNDFFSFEIIEFLDSNELLCKREREIVNQELLNDSKCMNLIIGGIGGFSHETQVENSKKAIKRKEEIRKNDPEWQLNLNKKTGNGLRNYYRNNNVVGTFFGKKHSELSKEKISKANKISLSGSGNSQYGTCWITNDIENKKMLKSNNLPDGWHYGRVMKKIEGN